MRDDIWGTIKAVIKEWWLIFVVLGLGLIGYIATVSQSAITFPTWFWIALACAALVVAQFRVIYRQQRSHRRQEQILDKALPALMREHARAAIQIRDRSSVNALLAELDAEAERRKAPPKPTLRCTPRTEVAPSGWTVLRVAIENEGPGEAPTGLLLNFLVPQAWKTFQPCDENGHKEVRGKVFKSDEALKNIDGEDVPAWLWTYRTQESIPETATLLQFFQVAGVEAGKYAVSFRVTGHSTDDYHLDVSDLPQHRTWAAF
jgi:hypothetical protein